MRSVLLPLICLVVGIAVGIGLSLLFRPSSDSSHELSLIREEMRTLAARPSPTPLSLDVSLLRQVPSLTAPRETEDPAEFLAVARARLQEGKPQEAYDALLAAMRISPGNYDVFLASLEFVSKAAKVNDEGLALAIDIHERAAGLIPFLSLPHLKEARQSHTAIGDELFAAEQPQSDTPFAEVERLLAVARRDDIPVAARAALLNDLEGELNGCAKQLASGTIEEGDTSQWAQWQAMKASYESAQKDVLAAMYKEDCQKRLAAWRKSVTDFIKNKADLPLEQVHAANTEIIALVNEGTRLYRDVTPYVEAGIDAAIQDNGIAHESIEQQVVQLAQWREWNYNRWVVDRIATVNKSGGTPFERLTSLIEIDDTRLAPYAAQQFAETWQRLFDDCEDGEKIEATRIRILRRSGK